MQCMACRRAFREQQGFDRYGSPGCPNIPTHTMSDQPAPSSAAARAKTPASGDVPANVPAQWAWHYRRLHELGQGLLKSRSAQIEEASEGVDLKSVDPADSATDEADHGLAFGFLSHKLDALYELEAASRRILDGTYGICEESGQPIPAERLRAVPWTRFTREVEERLEEQSLLNRARVSFRSTPT